MVLRDLIPTTGELKSLLPRGYELTFLGGEHGSSLKKLTDITRLLAFGTLIVGSAISSGTPDILNEIGGNAKNLSGLYLIADALHSPFRWY